MLNKLISRLFGKNRETLKPEITGKIIAAKVTKAMKHPNADRLRVISLTDGANSYGPIVCGAFNFSEDDIVALALPGAHIAHNIHSDEHESFTLGKATIRGIESQGMICAEFELGLSDEIGEGVMILPEDTKLGKIIA
jgi:phenylalanyl-tRNA synthetase beta chain